MRVRFSKTDYVSEVQIESLLAVANEEMGTSFRLGIVTQGGRCRFNRDLKHWNKGPIRQTTVQLPAWEPTVNLKPRDQPSPAPPIIWIYNDDESNREAVSDIPKGNTL